MNVLNDFGWGQAWVLAESNPWVWPIVVIVLIFLVVFIPRAKRRQKQQSVGRVRNQSPDTADRIQLSLEKLMVELFDLSRDVNAQMDTRIATLNQLIQEADRKINQLKRLAAGQVQNENPPPQPERELPEEQEIPRPLLKTATSDDPQHREIYRLADEGVSLSDISRQTGRPLGEIQLILDLRRAEG